MWRLSGLWAQVGGVASTRRLALLRIGIALLVWVRFADDFALYQGRGWVWGLTGAAIYLASTALLLGWRSRLAALATGASLAFAVVYLGVVQRHYALVHHHISLLMIVTLLLALTPCGRSLSLDRWRALRAGAALPEVGPVWGTWLIALQASAVWFWGGIDKLHLGWLSGERLQAIAMSQYWGSDWPAWPGFAATMMVLAVSAVLVELALAIGMFFPRWHPVLVPTAVVFHGIIYFTVPVATFTATMYVLLLAFVPADRVHAVIDRLLAAPPPRTMPG